MNSMIVARAFALICLLLLAPLAARAVQPDEIMTDPRLEARARALSAQLRCLVCQNESIDESHADLARDLRVLVRERLQAGDGDDQIRAFLVHRYGDFILLKPPFKLETWLLWGAPFLILLTGGGIILVARRRQKSLAPATSLSEAERATLDSLLGEGALKRAVGERHDRDIRMNTGEQPLDPSPQRRVPLRERQHIIESGARQSHQTASFADGKTSGPLMTDVVALLGRGTFFDAPFRNSISSACRPTMRSRAAIFASYS